MVKLNYFCNLQKCWTISILFSNECADFPRGLRPLDSRKEACHGAPPHTPQGVTDSVTAVSGQTMRKIRLGWPQAAVGQARGEAA
ncbi:MAG: hypothetical protein LBJ13_02640, partial [Puniceicoccales bacterium]|nr:hypothetical protein [Puniceicoccales bacterium]